LLLVGNGADMTSIVGKVFFTAEKTWSDMTTKYRISAVTVSNECIVLPIFLCRKLAMLSLFRTHTVYTKVKRSFLPILWICGYRKLLDPSDALCSVLKLSEGSRLSARTNP
jgi:hypothetical protein